MIHHLTVVIWKAHRLEAVISFTYVYTQKKMDAVRKRIKSDRLCDMH